MANAREEERLAALGAGVAAQQQPRSTVRMQRVAVEAANDAARRVRRICLEQANGTLAGLTHGACRGSSPQG